MIVRMSLSPMTSEPIHADFLAMACRLARESADIARTHLDRRAVMRKADDSVVTQADHAVQAHILAAIANAYPDHAVCAEELMKDPGAHAPLGSARYAWVIDPIDGTRNFAVGLPCYATSIAVLDRGSPIVGAVYEHNLQMMFTAQIGGGARLNDQPIDALHPVDHGDILVGVPSNKDPLTEAVLTRWLATPGIVYRSLGSTAYHLGLVACGALDAMFCKRCKIWDIAAGALLVTEARGIITDPWGKERLPFDLTREGGEDLPTLAARPHVHALLLKSCYELLST